MKINKPLRRLPLAGTCNTRDLGGYPCEGGSVRFGQFVRSDCPENLTPEDIEYLRAYGVCDVVDLRRADEDVHNPSALRGQAGFTVHGLSVNDTIHGLDFEGDIPGSMSGLYILILDGAQPELLHIMQVMAAAPAGVLFHCAVGKDRTGVVAMLLLKLAGVADADVVADYAVTDIYMNDAYEAQKGVFQAELPEYILQSKPVSMQRALRHLREKYGTAAEYLQKIGLSAAEISNLRQKLLLPAEEAKPAEI